MSAKFSFISWNSQKKRYDLILLSFLLFFNSCFITFQLLFYDSITAETLLLRCTSLSAFLLLNFILSIGPLARINTNFLPFLYNRRHLGVSMFLLAAIHGIISLIQFHALGDSNPFYSLFTANPNYLKISDFPFQVLGFFALLIFFAMAATSHDFWLHKITPQVWKRLHKLVYLAFALVVAHVALGALVYETHPVYRVLLFLSFAWITGIHIYARVKSPNPNTQKPLPSQGAEFHQICHVDEISENKAKIFVIGKESIAVFRYQNKFSAVHNVCKHQMGPLGEGRIVDGCITCPWHGYQYLPGNGQSPPPFTEKLKTYKVQIKDDMIWLNPNPEVEGTPIEPAVYQGKQNHG
ncbi:MAG: Rieske 2Fe-2S domain-containing protein [Spirochaetota bacterium]